MGTETLQAEPLGIVSQSAIYDPAKGLVTFEINFNRAPAFYKVDSHGRQPDDFQYFIVGDSSASGYAMYDAIIRGSEIHFGAGISVRSATPPSSDPASGGWGPVRTRVPFKLRGTRLTFSVPLTAISNHSREGRFHFNLQTDTYGGMNEDLASQSSVGPPPYCQFPSTMLEFPVQRGEAVVQATAGLKAIEVSDSANTSVNIPSFPSGTTAAVRVTITPVDRTLRSSVTFSVTDAKGNVTMCHAGQVQPKP